MSFILSSDSCCDAYKSFLKQKNVFYLPMSYYIDEVPYFDNFDSLEEYRSFYDGLRKGQMPKTSQANAFETAEYFEKLLKENEGDIIHLSLSSGLSTTAENAQIAAREVMSKYSHRKIYAIDSKAATQGQKYLLDKAIKMREEGFSAEDTAKEVEETVDRLHHFIVAKDLFHLKRGGRISGVAAVFGTVLNIRPIIVINHKGQLVVIGKERGMTKSLKFLVKSLLKYRAEGETSAYIAHADDIETATELKKLLLEEGIKEITIGYIGPVIGSHTGPGTLGLVFEGTKRLTVEQKEK